MAFWFLDRHLRRTRPDWVERTIAAWFVPLVVAMIWFFSHNDRAAGRQRSVLANYATCGSRASARCFSHLLVSVHVFLEMLHYGVWLFALPLITARISRALPVGTLDRKRPLIWQ